MKSPFLSSLWKPTDAAGLILFRKVFAICLFIQVFEFYAADMINKTFVINHMLLPFHFSAWLPALPGKLMHLPFLAQIVAAILLFTDKHAKKGAVIYFISFSYVVLLDISYYNNHFYMELLLIFFFFFCHPQRISGKDYVPALLLWIFRLQVIAVYFFGGIAKLNPDWLIHHEPMRQMLQNTMGTNVSGGLVSFYTYSGLIFDLTIGLLLVLPATRRPAILLTILFHLSNLLMFKSGKNVSIGIFPFLMMATNLLFTDAAWLRNRVPFFFPVPKQNKKSNTAVVFLQPGDRRKKIILSGLLLYLLLQLFLPLRHFLIPGNVDWTNEGYYFAWRMKIRAKQTNLKINAIDESNGKSTVIQPFRFMNTSQYKAMCEDPAAMHFFIQLLKQKALKMGMKKPAFYLNWTCSLNGRAPQAVVDSTADFGSFKFSRFAHNTWILPLKSR